MAEATHRYAVRVEWTGNTGTGTRRYAGYERRHDISVPGTAKPVIPGSSDPAFRGDPGRWNPEELLVAALSACHKLWYLALCAGAGIEVVAYEDAAEGVMHEEAGGGGLFDEVVLRPRVTVAAGSDLALAASLHEVAHARCYIANSVNFPVLHQPQIVEDRAA